MNVNGIRMIRPVGLVGAAALAIGLATANPAAAAPSPASLAASGSGVATVAHDTLTVIGTSANDRIALRLAPGDAGTLQVDFGDDGSAERSFDRSTFSAIVVFAGSGNDQVRIDQANGIFADEATKIVTGSGNDVIDGGDASELFFTGSGNDAVDGNRGNDTAYLGSGQDSFRWDPGDGSDVVEGQSGTDTLDFNGAGVDENMSLSPNGRRSLFLRANIRMDMDDVERLDLTALGGVDTVTVDDMSGTDFQQADVDLSGPSGGGDGQADTVTVNGTAGGDDIDVRTDGSPVDVEGLQTGVAITGSETIDRLQVNGLGGNDTVDVDEDVAAFITVAVDLGTGQA